MDPATIPALEFLSLDSHNSSCFEVLGTAPFSSTGSGLWLTVYLPGLLSGLRMEVLGLLVGGGLAFGSVGV